MCGGRRNTVEQRRGVDVVFLLLHIAHHLLLHQLLRTVGGDHLGVENALQVMFRQAGLELSERLHDARLDLIDLRLTRRTLSHRYFISKEQVQVLDLDQSLVVAVDSTPNASFLRPQLEDQLGVLPTETLLARQTRRQELRVVDQTWT